MMLAAAPVRACAAALLVLCAGSAPAQTPAPDLMLAREAFAGIAELLRGKDGAGIPEPVPPDQAFVLTAAATPPRTLDLRFTIHDCCYLYRDKLRFALTRADGTLVSGGPRLGEIRLAPGEAMTDAYFGKSVVYRDVLDLRLPLLDLPPNAAFLLEVTYQGCSEEGVILCYEPLTRRFVLRTVNGQLLVENGTAPPTS